MMAQVLRPLLLIWKTRIELLAGAAMAMPWKALGGWSSLASRMGLLNEVSTMWP